MSKVVWCAFAVLTLGWSPLMLSAQVRPTPLHPVIILLDGNGDGQLSEAEIQDAPRAFLSLDEDGSGDLNATEWGGVTPRSVRIGPDSVLDANRDKMLSRPEIDNSVMVLLALDADNSGSLVLHEWSAVGLIMLGSPAPGDPDPLAPPVYPSRPLLPTEIDPARGSATIQDLAAFRILSYQGSDIAGETSMRGLEFVKFVLTDVGTSEPKTYFQNTELHRAHPTFLRAMGLPYTGVGLLRGILVYRPLHGSADGAPGLFTFEFEPGDRYPYQTIRIAFDELVKHAPFLKGRLAYHVLPTAMPVYRQEQAQYESGALPVFLDEDAYANIAYLPLNVAAGYGLLRVMKGDGRPGLRDIVLYESLPNEMPRVGGVITGVPQTPLSHVNLRAVQDNVPNAFIKGGAEDPRIARLIGKNVYFRVGAEGFEIREATTAEVNAHFAALRPSTARAPVRDLSVTRIRPLDEVGFEDARSVGVKAANVATLRKIGLPDGVVPNGFAIPFWFYDQFMQANGFYAEAQRMMADPQFQSDSDRREKALESFRARIEKATMPASMMQALATLQSSFPAGVPIRMRSSTNNEDLTGFSGAGLYDSFTHNPDEDHISKTVKQVFASLWNLRAFEEREFYRIDHLQAAMGVLVHPNYSNERANGVAVTDDIVYQTQGQNLGRPYYVNVQLGEDLVTNPNAESVPEEIILNSVTRSADRVVRMSNRAPGQSLLSPEHREEMRAYLNRIHNKFRELYEVQSGQPFAMEIEFKITAQGRLEIKQARPWVY
jgi:hypothetical protein